MRLRKRSRRIDGRRRWLVLSLFAFACGGAKTEVKEPPKSETPADEVLRIAANWVSVQPMNAILSPPSPLSVIRGSIKSNIHLTKKDAEEELTIVEDIELRGGGKVLCESVFRHPVTIRYGRKGGEAAVELGRPALNGRRTCQGVHPEPDLVADPLVALFVLKSDQLVAIEPRTDGRTYLPES